MDSLKRRAVPKRDRRWPAVAVATVSALALLASTTTAAPPGWQLAWSDDFETLDERTWRLVSSPAATGDAECMYSPDQISVGDGQLVIRSDRPTADGGAYRSGQIVSRHAQRFGRWEVRARVAAGRGARSAIRLSPTPPSTSPYEIDILSNRGERPTITASACRWGRRLPDEQIVLEQQTSLAGRVVSYPDGFHTYAVEWLDDQLRFYVDEVYHGVLYSDEVGGFFGRHSEPMQLVIGTELGGEMPLADEATSWPRRFAIDWVRVYDRSPRFKPQEFQNGGFEANGGTLAGWHVFGSRVNGDPNVSAHREAVMEGQASLKLFGPSSGGESFSGVTQGISVAGGQRVRARLAARVRSAERLSETGNRVFQKIEFYDKWGDYFGGPSMLAFKERLIADGSTPHDVWQEHELSATAPEGAVEARLSLVFAQRGNDAGAVHIDAVEFAVVED